MCILDLIILLKVNKANKMVFKVSTEDMISTTVPAVKFRDIKPYKWLPI